MTATLTWPVPATPAIAPACERWLAVVSHTDPRYGGLSTAVPRIAESVNATRRFHVDLAAFCLPGEQVRPEASGEAQVSFWPTSRGAWLRSQALRQRFVARIRESDGVHLHGLWEASTVIGSRTALSQGRPYVLSAHGMLEPWALANKRVKKLLYAAALEHKTVARAACLHALTRAEAGQYRSFGARGPIAVIPNAVEVPKERSAHALFAKYPELQGRRLVLFLGRLHPKKGLDLLAEAWAEVARQHADAHLVLAGPDSEGTKARLQARIGAADLDGRVTFTGMISGKLKWAALSAAEIFILPSFSEGLSMGVLEALGAGVPVIVTRNCNMPEVTEHKAGLEIGPEVGEVAAGLHAMLSRGAEENQEMGARGAALIASRYSPQRVAEQTAEMYEFVLHGTAPTMVEMQRGTRG